MARCCLTIKWQSLYQYRAELAFETGEIIEYVDTSPVRCIYQAKRKIEAQHLKATEIQSVVEYLSPVNEIIEAVHQLTT